MFKKFESDVRRKVKEIMAVALSFCLLFGTLGMPIKVTAAGGGDDHKEYSTSSIEYSTVLYPGDVIANSSSNEYINVRYWLANFDNNNWDHAEFIPFDDEWGEYKETGIDVGEATFRNHSFVMPVAPGTQTANYIYIVKTINSEETDIDIDGETTHVKIITIDVTAYQGYKLQFCNSDGTRINDLDYCVYLFVTDSEEETRKNITSDSFPSLNDEYMGDVVGWSFIDNYIKYSSGETSFFDINYLLYHNLGEYAHEGIIKLYPVYRYLPSTLEITMENYYEGGISGPTLESNVPEELRSISMVFEKKNDDGSWTEVGEEPPSEEGTYRVTAYMEQAGNTTISEVVVEHYLLSGIDTVEITGNRITSRGYAEAFASTTFTVLPRITTKPAAKSLTYNGSEQALISEGEVQSGTGHMLYSLDEEDEFTEEIPVAKNAGDYTVWYMVEGIEEYDNIEPRSIEVSIAPKTIGIKWDEETDFAYDGNTHCPNAIATEICDGDTCSITVKGEASKVGKYTATVTGLSNSNYVLPEDVEKTFTISAVGSSIKTDPVSKVLTYNGQEQELVSVGEAIGGEVVYSLSEDGSFSSEIPKGKDAGNYTIWYMVSGDENHSDSSKGSIVTSISKKTVGLEWSDTEFTYDGKEHCPTATATGLCDGDTCTVTVTGGATVAGKYTATATSLSNSNYALGSDTTQSFEIKEPPVATITEKPEANELTYNGNSQRLVTQGKAEGGVIIFSTSKDGEYSSVIPKAKDAGDYTVWYMAQGEEGIKDSEPSSIKVTIAPKTVGLKWSETEFMYDGKEHCPTVELTDICDGDTCTVKVTGAQKEIGIYTAKATSLSNSNYQLPSDNTKEFSILDPNKKKGVVSVSMASFIYGGRASTPVITSKTNDVSKASVLYKPSSSSDSAYSVTVPTEVGNYTVKVTLPKNEEYNACSATASFSITYLTVGNDAYSVEGTRGKNGFYTTSVTVSPGAGYELSYGDRNHFTGNSIKVEDSLTSVSFYLRNANTGEQTDVISLDNLKIDSSAPQVVNLEKMGVYFASGDGSVKCIVKDKNLDKVVMGDNELKLIEDGGNTYFNIPVGNGRQTVTFTVYDLAGNKTDFSVVVAPSWLENGEIVSGTWYLNANESFTFPEGTTWTVNNGSTVYVGGSTFYVKEPGEYTFTMN